ncbi:MAG: hypothetical protein AAF598_01630, partial [Bacteroidota bacterium]
MRLLFNYLTSLTLFGLLCLFPACKEETSKLLPDVVAYLQVAHPVSDSLIQTMNLEQATRLMVWPKRSALSDSLFLQHPNWQFGALVDDFLKDQLDTARLNPVLLQVHQQAKQATFPWLSEESLLACPYTTHRTDYLQQRTLELQHRGVCIDLDKSLLTEAHKPALFNALLQDFDERNRNILAFSQLVGLSGFSSIFPEGDSMVYPHPDVQEQLKNWCQKGLAVIKISEEAIQRLAPIWPLDSFRVYLRDTLQFQGLLSLELDLPRMPKEGQLQAYIAAGFQSFIVSKNLEVLVERLEKISRKEKNNLFAAAHEQLKIAEWAGLLDQEMADPVPSFFSRDSLARIVLNQQLQRQSICLAQDSNEHVPVSNQHLDNVFLLTLGKHRPAQFIKQARAYCNPGLFHFYESETAHLKRSDRSYYQHLVVGISDTPLDTCDHKALIEAIHQTAQTKRVTIVNFGHPENIDLFDRTPSFIQVFSLGEQAEALAAQSLFGGQKIQGQWPRTEQIQIAFGAGLKRDQAT